MKIDLKQLKKESNEIKPVVDIISECPLVYRLEETIDTLALNLQKKIIEKMTPWVPPDYVAVGINVIKGLENALEEINEHFGTSYESDHDKLFVYFNKPAQKSKN